MIISVNGKIGSGKDTVGSIIQYLTDENVKGMSFEDWYASNVYSVYQATGKWEIKKFAGKLKQIASLLTGIPIEKFEDQEFKKTYLGEEWNSPYNIPFSGPDFVKHDGAMTVRTLLQRLGTEAMRDNLHENVWVNALFADYKAGDPEWDAFYPNWIITDMRFENELEAIVKHKGITIRVVRPGKTLTGTHPSEIALDGFIMHYEIINAGTIEDLIERVREILIKENII